MLNQFKPIVLAMPCLLLLVTACTTTHTPSRPFSPLAFVSWDNNLALVVKNQRVRAAEALDAKVISEREWAVPIPGGEATYIEVLAIDQIPAEFTASCIASAEPLPNMKCVVTQPAREECKNLGDSSAYIWYKPVRKCEPGGVTDKCTPLVNKPIAHFDLYRTRDCTGNPVRRQVVVPGDSCQ
ncbi:MAG TPA: hypothetical protein VJ327_03555 [Patescibacteria group bacterium]|nr:hypothetical protein [Patescibacteria group bacterium]